MATLMTVDEDEEGVALAFCICQSESTITMKAFFAAVEKKIGFQNKTDTFLTDDANAGSEQPQKRLCAWHVNKNWIAILAQIPNEPLEPKKFDKSGEAITKRSHCKSRRFSLRVELDEEVFKTKLTEFLKLLNEDTAYAKFREYFVKTYESRVKQWAYAYLSAYGGYNTNMYLES